VRTNPASSAAKAGRLAKARQFADVARSVLVLADEADDVADAFVTLAVHAGIAAADVICCVRLGYYARGDSHNEAVDLLKDADTASSNSLRVLLNLKTAAGYSYAPVSAQDRVRAERAMDALVARAVELT
jgi:hypothetical protein